MLATPRALHKGLTRRRCLLPRRDIRVAEEVARASADGEDGRRVLGTHSTSLPDRNPTTPVPGRASEPSGDHARTLEGRDSNEGDERVLETPPRRTTPPGRDTTPENLSQEVETGGEDGRDGEGAEPSVEGGSGAIVELVKSETHSNGEALDSSALGLKEEAMGQQGGGGAGMDLEGEGASSFSPTLGVNTSAGGVLTSFIEGPKEPQAREEIPEEAPERAEGDWEVAMQELWAIGSAIFCDDFNVSESDEEMRLSAEGTELAVDSKEKMTGQGSGGGQDVVVPRRDASASTIPHASGVDTSADGMPMCFPNESEKPKARPEMSVEGSLKAMAAWQLRVQRIFESASRADHDMQHEEMRPSAGEFKNVATSPAGDRGELTVEGGASSKLDTPIEEKTPASAGTPDKSPVMITAGEMGRTGGGWELSAEVKLEGAAGIPRASELDISANAMLNISQNFSPSAMEIHEEETAHAGGGAELSVEVQSGGATATQPPHIGVEQTSGAKVCEKCELPAESVGGEHPLASRLTTLETDGCGRVSSPAMSTTLQGPRVVTSRQSPVVEAGVMVGVVAESPGERVVSSGRLRDVLGVHAEEFGEAVDLSEGVEAASESPDTSCTSSSATHDDHALNSVSKVAGEVAPADGGAGAGLGDGVEVACVEELEALAEDAEGRQVTRQRVKGEEVPASGLVELKTSEVPFRESAASQGDTHSPAAVTPALAASSLQPLVQVKDAREGHAAGTPTGSLRVEALLGEQAEGKIPGAHTATSAKTQLTVASGSDRGGATTTPASETSVSLREPESPQNLEITAAAAGQSVSETGVKSPGRVASPNTTAPAAKPTPASETVRGDHASSKPTTPFTARASQWSGGLASCLRRTHVLAHRARNLSCSPLVLRRANVPRRPQKAPLERDLFFTPEEWRRITRETEPREWELIRRRGGSIPIGWTLDFLPGIWEPRQLTIEELQWEIARVERLVVALGLSVHTTPGSASSSPRPPHPEKSSDAVSEGGEPERGQAGSGELQSKTDARLGGAGAWAGRGQSETPHVVTTGGNEEGASSGETTPRANLTAGRPATATGRRAALPEPKAALKTTVEVVVQPSDGSDLSGAKSGRATSVRLQPAKGPVRREQEKSVESATSRDDDLTSPAAATPPTAACSPQQLVVAEPRGGGAATPPGGSVTGQVLKQAAGEGWGRQSRWRPEALFFKNPAFKPSRPRTPPPGPVRPWAVSPRNLFSAFANQILDDHTDCPTCDFVRLPLFDPSDGGLSVDSECGSAGVSAGCPDCDQILRARYHRNCEDLLVEDTQPVRRGPIQLEDVEPVRRGAVPLDATPQRDAQGAARGFQRCCRAVASVFKFGKALSSGLSAAPVEVSSVKVDDLLPPDKAVPPQVHKVQQTKAALPVKPVVRVPAGPSTSCCVKPFSSGQPSAPAAISPRALLELQAGLQSTKNKPAANQRRPRQNTVQCVPKSNPQAMLREINPIVTRRDKNWSGWGVLAFLRLVPKDKGAQGAAASAAGGV
jgi:hypothetical protein